MVWSIVKAGSQIDQTLDTHHLSNLQASIALANQLSTQISRNLRRMMGSYATGHLDDRARSSGGFACGGWAVNYWNEVMGEAMAVPYDLLLGRKTYESFAAHWPNASDDPTANMMNNATKYVATSTLDTLGWKNSTRITGDIAAEVSRLKKQDGPLLQVHGSWQLIQSLLSHELIDEFRLWTFPVVVGPGKRLFGPETVPTGLTLVKTKPCTNGAMMCIYRCAGHVRAT